MCDLVRSFNTIRGTLRRGIALPDSVLPATQFSVNLVRGKVFRSEILTEPLANVTVVWGTSVLKCCEKRSKTARSSENKVSCTTAVLGRWSIMQERTGRVRSRREQK